MDLPWHGLFKGIEVHHKVAGFGKQVHHPSDQNPQMTALHFMEELHLL